MTPAQSKRQKISTNSAESDNNNIIKDSTQLKDETTLTTNTVSVGTETGCNNTNNKYLSNVEEEEASNNNNSFGLDVGDLTDDTDSDEEDDDDLDDDNTINGSGKLGNDSISGSAGNHADIQEQLAAAGPAGVAAAAAIATARKRKRPHSFETNPSVRKRQQTRLIRKLRACIDEYTMRVGQQAVVLITMPGKAVHNFKVFGAQPLESVIRTCKQEIMSELEQALLEQAPITFKEDGDKHELPPLVIDGIPTPVEKMTQAQLRAFIPLMLKYSTGRGKPGWGKDSTRPPWWPETLPWANVRSDARDESEKQRISWTTTLRQIVTNCYRYHGRDDLLPTFDENEEATTNKQNEQEQHNNVNSNNNNNNNNNNSSSGNNNNRRYASGLGAHHQHHHQMGTRSLGSSSTRSAQQHLQQQQQQQNKDALATLNCNNQQQQQQQTAVYSAQTAYAASNFVHTITNSDGTVSLIQVDPANAQILTLPDGTQVRAVRLQTLGTESFGACQQISELHDANGNTIELSAIATADPNAVSAAGGPTGATAVSVSAASLGPDGQIIVTGEDGIQSCYPMSSLVSIPASVYQQFTQGGHQQLSILAADGTTIPANAISIHSIQEEHPQQHQQQSSDESIQQASQQESQLEQQHQQHHVGGQPHQLDQNQQKEVKLEHSNGITTNNNNSNETIDRNNQNGT